MRKYLICNLVTADEGKDVVVPILRRFEYVGMHAAGRKVLGNDPLREAASLESGTDVGPRTHDDPESHLVREF